MVFVSFAGERKGGGLSEKETAEVRPYRMVVAFGRVIPLELIMMVSTNSRPIGGLIFRFSF
ncbi:hypothetical protein EU538_11615 [Candidatus Thorarchaeota archaeon]|nr:MAG: hypothetical protein EU538_11615 [Candidatus Thorarchaeota archaeon]